MNYEQFLKSKAIADNACGFKPVWMPDFLFPFQTLLVDWAINRGRAAVYADCGLGKGHPDGTRILSPNGWVNIEDLSIGDLVIGRDGTPYPVTGIYDRGLQNTFEVFFDDDTSVVVDSGHLWAVKSHNDKKRGKDWRTVSTSELVASKLKYGTTQQSRTWHIPMVQPIEFGTKELPVDPYILGVLLGDGELKSGPQWTKPDEFIAEKVNKRLPEGCKVNKKMGNRWSIVTEPKFAKNPIRQAIADMGLMVNSPDKFVPECYLFSSYKQRLQLLRGLMDTDGYSGESPEFSSSSKELAEAVVFLVQSMGGTASIKVKEEPTYEYEGEKRIGLPSWRVILSLTGINPFSLPRKRNLWKSPSRGIGRWIDRIEPRGIQKTTCISVNSPDSLYVTEHCIVTHNTPMQLVWAENVVRHTNKKVLILCPLSVSPQTIREGEKFGIKVHRSWKGEAKKGINITNYERLHHHDPKDYAGVALDEAGILKNFEGKYRKEITNFLAQVKHRSLWSATPAPNDWMELGTQSEALGEMGRNQMLGMFFTNGGETTQQWELKGHARRRYWRWVSTWARTIRKPSDFGFDDDGFILPPLNVQRHLVPAAMKKRGFRAEARTLEEQRDEKRKTLIPRCEKVASLVPKGKPFVAWCHLNTEGDLLEKLIPGAVQVSGSDSDEEKEEAFIAFASGQAKVLVTKPKIASHGLNWQHCCDMSVFPHHSHEAYYQLVRRCWRFGQKNPVNVNMVASEAELPVLKNMLRKEQQATEMFSGVIKEMHEFQTGKVKEDNHLVEMQIPLWLAK